MIFSGLSVEQILLLSIKKIPWQQASPLRGTLCVLWETADFSCLWWTVSVHHQGKFCLLCNLLQIAVQLGNVTQNKCQHPQDSMWILISSQDQAPAGFLLCYPWRHWISASPDLLLRRLSLVIQIYRTCYCAAQKWEANSRYFFCTEEERRLVSTNLSILHF